MAQRYEKEMKKADKKNIIIKYKQYLKLEKSLSANTVEAYLTDLDKLFAFLELENIHLRMSPWKIWKLFQPDYATSAFTRVPKHAFCPGYAPFSAFFCSKTTYSKTRQNYWNRHKSANTCPTC